MTLENQDLINLPVYTKSGQNLGRVDHFEIDQSSHTILRYYIKSGLLKGLWQEQLIVHRSQVISINKEKMIVEDNVKAVLEQAKAVKLAATPNK